MPLYRFTPHQRLLQPADFKAVFDDAPFKVHQSHFLVLACLNPHQQSARLGLVVAKKKVRRAHERNRIKRLARESFRLSQPWSFPLDVVIMPKVGIEQVSNVELYQQLEQVWSRLHRLAEKVVRTPV